ncbi:hypothetical protein [Streptomyces sp. NPDC015350]|uniref:hypothetical protein n=1 Tax=Streptomyces sp. NPDC015350 TaxID=3364955 RepID=UPI003700BCE1
MARPGLERPRTRAPDSQERWGIVVDQRGHDQVVESHLTIWLGPATAQYPQMHGGSIACTLRAAADWVHGYEGGLAVAEAVDAGTFDAGAGRLQLLAALSAAETIEAAARGA